MKKFIAASILALSLNFGTFATVSAAKPSNNPASSTPFGLDISWPQCGKKIPTTQAFAVIGVNGGLANNTNTCLSEQLVWGHRSVGGTSQEKLQLYVNTGNPGGLNTDSWRRESLFTAPQSIENPYGECGLLPAGTHGEDSSACAWQYGWNRSYENTHYRFPDAAERAGIDPSPSSYLWWLDVETLNTWKTGGTDADYESNLAVLEGMRAQLHSVDARVGIYSTGYQWNQITGGKVTEYSPLAGLPNWYPIGRANLDKAKRACQYGSLTPNSEIVMTQYIANNLDYNYSCSG